MKTTTVSKLKATLSEFLAKVKAGEEILVTERGKPIAKLVPLPSNGKHLPPHLMEMVRAGQIRLGSGKLPDEFWNLPRPKDAKGDVLGALIEEREEGR